MDTMFKNSGNSKTSDPHKLFFDLANKTDSKRINKYVVLSSLSDYHPWKNTKRSYKNNKFEISALMWNGEF